MKKGNKALVAFAAAALSTACSAGDIEATIITNLGIGTQYGNMVFVAVSLGKNANPSCSTNGTWAFVLPLTTPLQNQMLATLLAARTSQTPVSLYGSGVCDTYSGVETLQVINY